MLLTKRESTHFVWKVRCVLSEKTWIPPVYVLQLTVASNRGVHVAGDEVHRCTCLDYIHFFLGILHTCLKLVRCPTDTAFSMFVIENGTLHIVFSFLSNPVFGTANFADEQRSDKMVSEICSS